MTNINELKKKIEEAREELRYSWEFKNNTDRDVLSVSVKMDRLMNQYNKMVKK